MTRFNRSPRPLSGSLETLAQKLAPDTVLAETQRAWRDAVGAAIAQRAQPVAERAGVLTISCESSIWAQELDLMSEAILERLNQGLKRGQIARLKCVVGAAV
ncbi:MAG: DciA family protein [Solirubrobacteraceae bacterium]